MNDCIQINQGNIYLKLGDITKMEVDAVVNPANDRLILGGGVAGSIARAGGPSIQEECNRIGGTDVGGAVITGGGNLPANNVIHAVGPRMGEGNEDEKLKDATMNSLKVAEENNLTSIAFPAISTRIFGYPVDRCAKIMLDVCKEYLKYNLKVKDIYFCLWDETTYNIFLETLNKLNQ
jgi:O-acetyl-ADP-ribose deacetylase (regulator of RNase III)